MVEQGDCALKWESKAKDTYYNSIISHLIVAMMVVQFIISFSIWICMLRKYRRVLNKRYKATIWVIILLQVLLPVMFEL